jgi:MFS family permease
MAEPTDKGGESPRRRGGRLGAIRGNVLMMGLVSLFTDFSSEMMYPLLPVFFTGLVPLGWVAVYVGLMEGIAEAAASLLKLVSGRLADALGKRKILAVLGYGISTCCRPLMALAAAGWHIILLRFGDRIGKGIRTSPRDALISDSVDKADRGLAFSFHRAMDHAGAILGPLAAIAILYAFLGYGLWRGHETVATPEEMRALRVLFAIALIPGIAAMLSLVGKVREIAPTRSATAGLSSPPYGGSGERKYPSGIAAISSDTFTGAQEKKGALREMPARFYAFVGIVTLFALGNSSDLFLLLYGKTAFGFGMVQLLGLWIALHLSKVVFSFPGGMLSDRYGRRPLILAGWAVYALVYLGMAFVQTPGQFWMLMVAYGVFYGLTEGAEKALVADFVLSEHRGTAYGLYHGAVGLAALPASLVFGLFWKELGAPAAFGMGAGLAGVAAILLALLLSTTRGAEQH